MTEFIFLLLIVIVKKAVLFIIFLIRNNRVEIYIFHTAENIAFYLRIYFFQLCDKLLYLLPF